MDLVNQENPQPNKAKKIVLILLIVSVIAIIIIIMLMMYLANIPEKQIIKKDKIFVDDEEKTIQVGQVMITTDDGKNMLSIKELSSLIGFNYFNGEYSKFTEDINKCYIENIVEIEEIEEIEENNTNETKKNIRNIVGLEANSNIIYKTNSGSNLDYEYIEIKNEILSYNDNLYIHIEDIRGSIRNSCYIFGRKWFSYIYKWIYN